jgi:AcrR family transcriptional regulator
MAEIARRVGVVRATICVHLPTGDAPIDAAIQRAISEAAATIQATPGRVLTRTPVVRFTSR